MPGSASTQQTTQNIEKAVALFTVLVPSQIAILTAEATGWNPNDGDEIEGVVLAVKKGHSDVNDKDYPIIFLLHGDMECTAVHCFQTILQSEVFSQRPRPGEYMYIKQVGATGESKVAGQNPPIRYAVHVHRDAASSDPWEGFQQTSA